MELSARYSTTAIGIEQMLGLRRSMEITEEDLLRKLQSRINDRTLLTI